MTMKTSAAIEELAKLIRPENLMEREQHAADLIEWFNQLTTEYADLADLAKLYNDGQFRSWECGADGCDTRVYEATPDSWDAFQGTDQVDYMSYPVDATNQDHCDHHRCFGVRNAS